VSSSPNPRRSSCRSIRRGSLPEPTRTQAPSATSRVPRPSKPLIPRRRDDRPAPAWWTSDLTATTSATASCPIANGPPERSGAADRGDHGIDQPQLDPGLEDKRDRPVDRQRPATSHAGPHERDDPTSGTYRGATIPVARTSMSSSLSAALRPQWWGNADGASDADPRLRKAERRRHRRCAAERWCRSVMCPAGGTDVMSQDIGDRSNLRVRPVSCLGWVLGLVVAGGVAQAVNVGARFEHRRN